MHLVRYINKLWVIIREILKNMTKKDYYHIRETRKIGLQTFFLNLQNNNYDSTTDKLINKLKSELADLKRKKKNFINQELSNCEIDIHFLQRELLALSEMKIIYAYKNFETHLVWLLKASYNKELDKRIYKWETIKNFLGTKNIQLSKIKNYDEINELRILNNSIKHSIKAKPSDLKNIREFQNKENISHKDFIDFYDRVENSIMSFICLLSDKIESDLYIFDDKRLNILSDNLKERMDKTTLTNFISKLNSNK